LPSQPGNWLDQFGGRNGFDWGECGFGHVDAMPMVRGENRKEVGSGFDPAQMQGSTESLHDSTIVFNKP
jgi:hypothetical protein